MSAIRSHLPYKIYDIALRAAELDADQIYRLVLRAVSLIIFFRPYLVQG